MIQFPKSPEENEFLRAWIQQRIPDTDVGDDSVCIGVWRDEKLAAVAAYYHYRKADIEVSFASDNPRWATKQVITYILAFPFVQLQTQRCTAMVLKSNKRCRKLLHGLGFKEEGRHAHAGPNLETMFSYGLTNQEYVKRYGIKISTSTAAAG